MQEHCAQAPSQRWLRCTPAQVSPSLLLSCPSKQGCREQAATTAAKLFSLRLATSLPLDGLGTGRRAGCKLDELFRQWQLLPAAILPRGHLPVTSQTCNPHVMGEQPSSHQERLGPGGSCGCCQNNSSDTQPVPYMLQSCTQGRRLLGTACGPDTLSRLPQKPALHRMSTCFLQHTVIMFPNCSVSLIIRLLFVHFPYVHMWSTKEGPGLIAPVGSSGNRDSSFPIAKRSFLSDLGQTTYTQLLGVVRMPTSHRVEQE